MNKIVIIITILFIAQFYIIGQEVSQNDTQIRPLNSSMILPKMCFALKTYRDSVDTSYYMVFAIAYDRNTMNRKLKNFEYTKGDYVKFNFEDTTLYFYTDVPEYGDPKRFNDVVYTNTSVTFDKCNLKMTLKDLDFIASKKIESVNFVGKNYTMWRGGIKNKLFRKKLRELHQWCDYEDNN